MVTAETRSISFPGRDNAKNAELNQPLLDKKKFTRTTTVRFNQKKLNPSPDQIEIENLAANIKVSYFSFSF